LGAGKVDISAIPRHELGHAVLDGIRQPLLAVDAQRRIALRNARAEALLREGTLLRAYTGQRLHACGEANDRVLESALAELAGGERPRWALRLTAADGSSVNVQVQRLQWPHTPSLAVVTVFEPMPMAEKESALAASFNLTPAEARVAGYLTQGMAPKQVAALCGVSTCTVRSQVQTLFEKTGVRRQPELVRLLLLASTF
jgi:DNA-binding CsgD family transcriptional regulator